MKAIELAANARTAKKRNQVKALRHTGRLPAVIYGSGKGAEQLEVDKKGFQRMMASTSATAVLVDLDLAGDSRLALIQEVQHHPLSRQPLHVDFREVRKDQQVHVTVPVIPVGEAWNAAMAAGIADPNPYDGRDYDTIDLWSYDHYHASAEGSYLEALTVFAQVTGYDVRQFGGSERAAHELGIEGKVAEALQRIAAAQVGMAE